MIAFCIRSACAFLFSKQMTDIIDYNNILSVLKKRCTDEALSEAGNRIGKYQTLLDLAAVTDMFRIEREKVKTTLSLDLDRDFDFEYHSTHLTADVPTTEKTMPEIAQYRDNGLMRDPISVVSYFLPTPTEEELRQARSSNSVSYEQLEDKKDKIEKHRRDVVDICKSQVVTDQEINLAVAKAWNELRQVLGDIAKELKSTVEINEKRVKLYDELTKQYFPETQKASFKAISDYAKWKDGVYDELTPDILKEHVAKELVKVLQCGFVVLDTEHTFSIRSFNDEFSALAEVCEELTPLKNEYAFIRQLIDYKDGLYEIKDGTSLVKYLYDKRKTITPDKRDIFFDFIGLCHIVRDAVASGGDDGTEEVPESVKSAFKHCSAYVKERVREALNKYYDNEPAKLAVFEIAFFDGNYLKKNNQHKAFVKALMDWGLLTGNLGTIRSSIATKFSSLAKINVNEWDRTLDNEKKLYNDILNVIKK